MRIMRDIQYERDKDNARLSLLVIQTDYGAIYRDIGQLIYCSVLLLYRSLTLNNMHENVTSRNYFYYDSKLISKSLFIFLHAIFNWKLCYFVHINCNIFILSKFCYGLTLEADKKTVIFQFFLFLT